MKGKGPVYGHCKYCGLPFWSKWGMENHEANTCKTRQIAAPPRAPGGRIATVGVLPRVAVMMYPDPKPARSSGMG